MENIFRENQGGTVLFLGRVTNFTPQELANFLEEQGMKYADRYEGQEIALLVLSTMLTPLEEQLSYDLYDAKVPDVKLAFFEKYFTTHIKPNSLLMSLKLSNDQERLRRLLDNEAFADEVYLKLFKLYDWQGDGIHDSDANRDVTIGFVKRFYKPDGFRDPAMIYAPTTVMNIAQDTDTTEVLDAILTMPNHEIKVSRRDGRRPKNLRELVAFNEAISQESIKRLLSLNDDDINYFLASNASVSAKYQERIFENSDDAIKMMLAHNSALSDMLFEKLLDESAEVVKTLLSYQLFNMKRLALVEKSEWIEYIGSNIMIEDIVESLLQLGNERLDFRLASNVVVSTEYLKKLYHQYGDKIVTELCKNINLSVDMIEQFYAKGDEGIVNALATNISTPKAILAQLCERDDRELNKLLASNPSVDLYYLQQFQLDPSLIMILAKNETYGKNVLNNLGI